MCEKQLKLVSLRVFGCTNNAHIEKPFREKNSDFTKSCFLESSDNSNAYLIGVKYEKGAFNVRKSGNLTFREQKLSYKGSFSAAQNRLEK